jgi:hypothetical protein
MGNHDTIELVRKKKLSTRTRAGLAVAGFAAVGSIVAGCSPSNTEAKASDPVAEAPVDSGETAQNVPDIKQVGAGHEAETEQPHSFTADIGKGLKEYTQDSLKTDLMIKTSDYPTALEQSTRLAEEIEMIINTKDNDIRNVELRKAFTDALAGDAQNGAILNVTPDDGTNGIDSFIDSVFALGDQIAMKNAGLDNPTHVTYTLHEDNTGNGLVVAGVVGETETTYSTMYVDVIGLDSAPTTFALQGAYQIQGDDKEVRIIGMKSSVLDPDDL